MNRIVMNAFFDELTKIADWTLTGPQGIGQFSATQIAGGQVPEGMRAGPSISQQMRHTDLQRGMQEHASQLREAKMQQMLQSGQWNPATHTVDMQGNLVPKKPMTPVTSGPAKDVTQAGRRKPRAASTGPAVGRSGTQITHEVTPSQIKGVESVVGRPPTAPTAQAAGVAGAGQAAGAAQAAHAGQAAAPVAEKAAPAAKGVGSRMMGRLSRMGRFGKAGLGAAALGLAGLGGYEMGHS